MALSDFIGRAEQNSLAGTLRGTLGGGEPDRQDLLVETGNVVRAFDQAALPGRFGQAEPSQIAQPFTPAVPQGGAAQNRIAQQQFEQGVGQKGAEILSVVTKPLRAVMDLLSNLDRPQQAAWGALIAAMEGRDVSDALVGGLTYRDPVTGEHNHHIAPEELLNSFAKNVLGVKSGIANMSGTAKFALSTATLIFADPLLLVPGSYYTKVGTRIKKFYHGAKDADLLRKQVTHGSDIRAAAASVLNNHVQEFIAKEGKSTGMLGQVYGRLVDDVSDAEIDQVRSFLSDWLTGRAVFGSARDDMLQLLTRQDMGVDEANSLLKRITQTPLDSGEVERMADDASAFLSTLRGESAMEPHFFRSVAVRGRGGREGVVVETLRDAGSDEFLVGQLVNKWGFAPADAARPEVLDASRRAIERAAASGEIEGLNKFRKQIAKEAGLNLPKGASKRFVELRGRAVNHGPFVVDAVTGDILKRRFARLGMDHTAAMELGLFASGVAPLKAISDIPEIMSTGGVMRTMMDSGDWNAKNWHILNGLMDPRTVLPRPIFARYKLAEDAMIAESNYLSKLMEREMTIGGKAIKEGSEVDLLIGRALNGDEKAQQALREWDDAGEAWRAFSVQRAYYDGMLERLAKLGIDDFASIHAKQAKGVPVMSEYFPRLYPTEAEGLKHAKEALGMDISTDIIRRAEQRSKDWHLLLTPQELDFVDGLHVGFGHGKGRKLDKETAAAIQSFSSLKAMRAYNHAVGRKIHLESAIKDVNNLSRAIDAGEVAAKPLSVNQKKYLSSLNKRLKGVESDQERMLNDTIEAIAGQFGVNLKPRPATRASMFITKRFYDGLLGLNLGFFMKNLTQGINTATINGPLNYMRGTAMMASDEYRTLRKERNLLAQFDPIFEDERFKGNSWGVKLKKLIYAPAHASEAINRGISFNAGMTDFLRRAGHGNTPLTELAAKHQDVYEEAINFAHNIANETQFIYGLVGRSPHAGSPVGRMALQFFSWPVKQIEFLTEGTLRNPDGPWNGARFFMNYVMLSGMFSKVAEHANVDAGSFAGFGFLPGGASPTTQAVMELGQAMYAAGVDDNEEEAAIHVEKLTKQLENMIPVWLQFQKSRSFIESQQTGERRTFRNRLGRRIDDTDRVTEAFQDINPLLSSLGLNEITGEQAVRFFGLPSVQDRQHRALISDLRKRKVEENRKARRFVDDYLLARASGDFHKAHDIRIEANRAGVPITPDMIERELIARKLTSVERSVGDLRASSEDRIRDEMEIKYPKAMRRNIQFLEPLPPNPIGNTASEGGIRP